MKPLAIRLGWQNAPTKSLVMGLPREDLPIMGLGTSAEMQEDAIDS